MKTYYFTCVMGYVGGSGVVKAPNIKEAVILANAAILKEEPTNTNPIDETDLTLVESNTAIIITNGDY